MSLMISKWRPSWWTADVHGSAWERAKEALKRDWAQTRHDFSMGGAPMNQGIVDTVKQAAGQAHLPPMSEPNPPKGLRTWREASALYWYGVAARKEHGGVHPHWSPELEATLKSEWTGASAHVGHDWAVVRSLVRRGFEYEDSTVTPPSVVVDPAEPKVAPRVVEDTHN